MFNPRKSANVKRPKKYAERVGFFSRLFAYTFLCVLPWALSSCASSPAAKKVLILGLDGLDPRVMTRLMDEGKLPHFSELRCNGSFSPLATSIPPESPVAWSTFLTGLDAGGHGIFDFIHRDPATMEPFLSTTTTVGSSWTLPLGRWRIPVWQGDIRLNRQGRAFWEILEDNGVPCTIVRIPANYPPTESDAKQLAGMGTPDIEGTYGTFSFYTDEPAGSYGEVSGGRIYHVRVRRDRVEASLPGPMNSFERGTPQVTIPFTVVIDASNPVAKVTIQDRQILLKPGEWSEWVPVSFEMLPLGAVSVGGIVRFYLKEIRPDFKLYVSPVNVDPANPVLPLSEPAGYVRELHEHLGYFSTLGIPEDTKSLSAGILDAGEFLAQSRLLQEEERRLLEYELKNFKSGVLFFYSGRADQVQHMFWREMESGDKQLGDTIEKLYQDMDDLLGYALSQVGPDTLVIALSDHGFAAFSRAFSLNNWLEQEGYAARQEDGGSGYLEPFDWKRTRAYGLGFAGLYLNLQGREKNGWLPASERNRLLDEIQKKLLEIRDPVNGEQVVTNVYRVDRVCSGEETGKGPDLVVGYNRGYRASWESVLGLFSPQVLTDNTDRWSGDHLMDPALVPGILFTNRPIKSANPGLVDLAPTILKEFGVEQDEKMKGTPIF